MEEWVKQILKDEKQKRGEPLEVKKIGQNYYLYQSTTVWVKGENKRKKVSKYIGKLTERGIVRGSRTKRYVRSIYEYGNAKLLIDIINEIIEPLKAAFPDDYGEIMAMGIVKILQPTPLKLIKSRWEKIYLSREIEVSLSPNIISEKLRYIGSDWSAQREFFGYLLRGSKYLLFDLSSIVSYSENLKLAEKGYNAEHLYLRQINFALIFSSEHNVPVMIKAIPGSIRDIKSFKHIVRSMGIKSCVVVLDRGFASYNLAELMKEKEIKFILPLRRNFKAIEYELEMEGSFIYRKRGINWVKKEVSEDFIYLYEDVKLRAEEETTFIEMMEDGKRTRRDMIKERKKFGKIAILSNINGSGEEVYLLYKQRESVEVAFDAMKNELESDKTYLSDDDAVRGYFFISFISLYIYFRILDILRQKNLIGKMSPNEVLFELSKVYLIYYSDGEKILSEIPAKAEKIESMLGLNLFPKTLRS